MLNYRPKNFVIILLMGACFFSSCKKKIFSDQYLHNPDPTVSTFPNTAQLLTKALYSSLGRGTAILINGDLLVIGDKEATFFVQYMTEAIYPGASLYTSTYGEWSSYYVNALMPLKTIIDYNTKADTKARAASNGSNSNQLAVARIWRAYLFSIMTDRWGDIPYSEANQLGLLTPKYDKQQDIYNSLFVELQQAIDQFDNGAAVKGDILFSGDQAQWKRFANSLRMILALRLSKVDPAKGKTEFQAAYANAAGYIASNSDNAVFAYQNNANFRNPWHNNFNETNKFGMSDFFISLLSSYNDPRLGVYADPISAGAYKGIPYGLSSSALAVWTGGNSYSDLGSAFRQQDSRGYLITAAQMLLTRAEAGLRGWITGTNVKADYENAIKASMQQNGITSTALIDAYIANPSVAIDVSNVTVALQKIATQKYLALFPNGFEAFAEWRRTGYPVLTPTAFALNASKQIPRRWGYPTDEAVLNPVNFQTGISGLGGSNSIDARVWWDKP
jgi:hypothetical protein